MLREQARIWNSIDLFELYSPEGGATLTRRQLVESLSKRIGNDVLVLSAIGVANIVVFRKLAQSLLKLVSNNDDSVIDTLIKRLGDEIVKEIKNTECDKTQYTTRLNRQTIENSVSGTLMRFLSKLSDRLNCTPAAYLIGNIGTNALTKCSTPLQIALGVLMRNSRALVNYISDMGVSCSYDELLRFKKSAAVAATTSSEFKGNSRQSVRDYTSCCR